MIFYKLTRNDSNLESTILGIHFPITQQHFVRGKLKVNSLYKIYHNFFPFLVLLKINSNYLAISLASARSKEKKFRFIFVFLCVCKRDFSIIFKLCQVRVIFNCLILFVREIDCSTSSNRGLIVKLTHTHKKNIKHKVVSVDLIYFNLSASHHHPSYREREWRHKFPLYYSLIQSLSLIHSSSAISSHDCQEYDDKEEGILIK